MAITTTHLTDGTPGSNNITSATTASISPVAGTIVLVSVASFSGTSAVPTCSGCNQTWDEVGSINNSTTNRVTVFRAVISNPTAGVLTFNWSTSQAEVVWSVDSFSLFDDSGGTNGSVAIVQSTTGASNTPSLTLAALGSGRNATFGVAADVGQAYATAGSGYTLLCGRGGTGNQIWISVEWAEPGSTTVDWGAAGQSGFSLIAMEIKAKAGFLGAMI